MKLGGSEFSGTNQGKIDKKLKHLKHKSQLLRSWEVEK